MKTLLMATVLGASLFTATAAHSQQPTALKQQPATTKPAATPAKARHATLARTAHKHPMATKKSTGSTHANANTTGRPLVGKTSTTPAKPVSMARPASPKPTTAPVNK